MAKQNVNDQTDRPSMALDSLLEGRVATYGFLARLYHGEVDQKFLNEMCTMRFPVNTGNEDVDQGNRLFHGYLSSLWERSLTELAVDYARVFLGNGVDAYSAAYPFESVFSSSKRLLMQDARDEILAIYHAYGVKPNESWKVSEDHISLELEFMKTLGQRALDALRSDDESTAAEQLMASYSFLTDHLISWTPMLITEVKKFAKTDFYQALAYATTGFLAVDRELLEELLAEELKDLQ
ncbi:MAG: molecular chaperone TorD family protein [Coriobacteriales bacterium]|jgi:TorA maturation chaperone TorD|nr:molecular chaperone TorD family protein [Coriobacteriales bacterium]